MLCECIVCCNKARDRNMQQFVTVDHTFKDNYTGHADTLKLLRTLYSSLFLLIPVFTTYCTYFCCLEATVIKLKLQHSVHRGLISSAITFYSSATHFTAGF